MGYIRASYSHRGRTKDSLVSNIKTIYLRLWCEIHRDQTKTITSSCSLRLSSTQFMVQHTHSEYLYWDYHLHSFFFIQHTDSEYLYPTQFIIHTVNIFLCFTFRYKNSIFTFIMISLALTRISVKPFELILWPHLTQHKIDRINGNLNNPSCWLEVQVTQQPNQHSLLFSIQTVNI